MKKRKKNILFIIHDISNAGIERVCLDILNGVNKEKYGLFVLLYQSKGQNTFDVNLPENITYFKRDIRTVRNKICRIIYLFYQIVRSIKKSNAKLIVSFIPFTNSIIFIIHSFMCYEHIATQHNLLSRDISLLKGKASIYKALLWKFIYKRLQYLITVSNSIKKDLISNFGVKENKVKVIYNGVDLERINQSIKNKLDISIDKYIVYVGRIEYQKSVDTLIQAFSIVRKSLNDLNLIVMGEGSLLVEIKKKVENIGCMQTIHFIGFQSNPYIYIKNALCLVLPSLFEGFGCVITEAMACGTPVIATNIEGPKEIITHGYNGLLFAPKDYEKLAMEIEKIINNEDLRKILISNGLRTVMKYTNMHEQYEELFDSIIKK